MLSERKNVLTLLQVWERAQRREVGHLANTFTWGSGLFSLQWDLFSGTYLAPRLDVDTRITAPLFAFVTLQCSNTGVRLLFH